MTRRAELERVTVDETTNLALWLDRFPGELRQEALRVHHGTIDKIRVPEGYERAYEARRLVLADAAGGFAGGETRTYRLALQGRAIVGIGTVSIRETGISLLRPWGVPVIPGSALKGLAARTAHASADPRWARPAVSGGEAGALHQLVFGDVKAAGSVTFHDAWWVPESTIGVHPDTMTVHHQEYYQGSGPPSDTDEPNPVSFLSSSGSYLVALSGPPDALNVVEAILEHGLRDLGIGAKTAAGYGRATLVREALPEKPQTPEERVRASYEEVRSEGGPKQAKWLLERGRDPISGIPEEERKRLIREDLAAGIAYLRAGEGSDEVSELDERLSEHRGRKPKDKKSKEFKSWKKDHDKLEKAREKAKQTQGNREAEQAKWAVFLAWLDEDAASE